jgi:hypothetical protein
MPHPSAKYASGSLILLAVPTPPQFFVRDVVSRAGAPALLTTSLTCLDGGRQQLNGSKQNCKAPLNTHIRVRLLSRICYNSQKEEVELRIDDTEVLKNKHI